MNGRAAPNELVDAVRPWLGLASFSEETSAWFHGRDEEVAELARRVQRKLLTVLFGQSGLGKTSLLRAGLVPRLRAQGYCPVYVRVDYSAGAPSPAAQVRRAILEAAPQSGFEAADESSLWELLHRRDAAIRDAQGRSVTPLLITDQFEEMFTLAQGDDAGAARAAAFVEELAALVENRPPPALEARFDTDDELVERFDFGRDDYRVLIALREDYLAHLEQLKSAMPSITQNRIRLAPMSGAQALAAVTGPGGRLVSQEVAAAIVRFVAAGAELAHAQVEPSLLSLICRELNEARIAAGRAEISLDLLAGSHASILSDFYERALADYPVGVRRVVEDILLTGSGFRENVAEERVIHALEQAGAPKGALADLVDRRLLRIEERLDIRRVELTHDVLCSVVRASRDQRREREALEEGERALAARQQRELAARRSLVRARQVAFACATLAVAALGASGYAFMATQRANTATATAREIQSTSDAARRQAEQLTAYLLDDFARELSGSSKQQMFVDLGKTVQAYYDALPDIVPNSDTELYRTLSQVTYTEALVRLGKRAQARDIIKQAVATIERRRKEMAPSEKNDLAFAKALLVQDALHLSDSRLADARQGAERAVQALAPRLRQAQPSLALQRLYARTLMDLGTYRMLFADLEGAEPVLSEALGLLRKLGKAMPADTTMSLEQARAASLMGEFYARSGKVEQCIPFYLEELALANAVIAVMPDHVIAIAARADAHQSLAVSYGRGYVPSKAYEHFALADRDMIRKLTLDPEDVEAKMGWFVNGLTWSRVLGAEGRSEEALAILRRISEKAEPETAKHAMLSDNFIRTKLLQAALHLEQDNMEAAARSINDADRVRTMHFGKDADPVLQTLFHTEVVTARIELASARGNHEQAGAMALQHLAAIGKDAEETGFEIEELKRVGAAALYRAGSARQAEMILAPVVARRVASFARDSQGRRRYSMGMFALYGDILHRLGRSDELRPMAEAAADLLKTEDVAANRRAQRGFVLARADLVIGLAARGTEQAQALAAAARHLAQLPKGVAHLRTVRQFGHELAVLRAANGGSPGA